MTHQSPDFPQLVYPGMPERSEPWLGDYHIVWSIYIRCNNRQKLRRVHIPALEAIIGQPHDGKGWLIEKEAENPSEIRLMTVEPVTGPYSDDLLLAFLKRLYALRPNWTINARLDEANPYGVYVCARYVEMQSDGRVPSLSNVMVELEPHFIV